MVEELSDLVLKLMNDTEGNAELVVGAVLYKAIMNYVLEPDHFPTLKKLEKVNDYIIMYGITMIVAKHIGSATMKQLSSELQKLKE